MKKMNCDIIKDVLPLYLDDVVSNATKEMIEEHLCSCVSCRKEAQALKEDIILPSTKNIQLSEARVFKNLKSKFRKKNAIKTVISVVITILIMIGLYSYATLSKTCIPYDNAAIHIDEANGKLYATYQGDNLGGTVSLDPSVITVDGSTKNAVVFYYYETPWSKYIQSMISDKNGKDKSEQIFCLGNKEDIDQIYYGTFRLDGSKIDYNTITENSDKIWDK